MPFGFAHQSGSLHVYIYICRCFFGFPNNVSIYDIFMYINIYLFFLFIVIEQYTGNIVEFCSTPNYCAFQHGKSLSNPDTFADERDPNPIPGKIRKVLEG